MPSPAPRRRVRPAAHRVRCLAATLAAVVALGALGALGALLSGAPARSEPPPAGEAPRRIGTLAWKDPGFVRIRESDLRALGAPDASCVEVRRRGRAVPVRARSSEPLPGKDLVFLAWDLATPASAWAVFELWLHPAPVAAAPLPPASPLAPGGVERHGGRTEPPPLPSLAPPNTMPAATRRWAEDRVHGALGAEDPAAYDLPGAPTWFLARIPMGQSVVTDLDPVGAAPGADQTLAATVWAARVGEVAIEASWGGRVLGTARAPLVAGRATLTWTLPASLVPPEGTALRLRDASPRLPPPSEHDVSEERGTLWVDDLAISGPVAARVGPSPRAFDLPRGAILDLLLPDPAWGPGGEVYAEAVGPEGAAIDLPDPIRWSVWTASTEPGWRLHVEAGELPAGTRLVAATAAADAHPLPAAPPPDPLSAAGKARHVVLAVPELLGGARALARHRTSTGTPSSAVDVTEVYDRYGGGEASVGAIQAFVADLLGREGAPLDHLLLAGDATYDRTDMVPFATIPAPMARTMFNGATPSDRLYALPPGGAPAGGPAVGRIPFRDAATMDGYVERLVRYETAPPADPGRRLFRFVTSEGRFGPLIDGLIERMFRTVLSRQIPPAYDVEVTYASLASPYLWPPPEFADKVIRNLNEGSLFLTYVGHGFGQGFDRLRAGDVSYPILHVDQAPRVACRGVPPVLFVVACTTATFDEGSTGIGEALLARPAGPLAYWGSTRICHPAGNTLFGRALARFMAEGEGRWRLGEILARARDEVLAPTETGLLQRIIEQAIRSLAEGADPDRLAREATLLYGLLGDPALRIPFPATDLEVGAEPGTGSVAVEVRAPLPDGTEVHLSVEVPRNRTARVAIPVEDPLDPESFPTVRANHDALNDLALLRTTVRLRGGQAAWVAVLPGRPPEGPQVVVKAWCVAEGDVHQGAATCATPLPPPADPPAK